MSEYDDKIWYNCKECAFSTTGMKYSDQHELENPGHIIEESIEHS